MKKLLIFCGAVCVAAQSGCGSLNSARVMDAGGKVVQAFTISDDQIMAYTKQFIDHSDSVNKVAGPNDPYTVRLNRIAQKFTKEDAVNLKVYITPDVNAFACATGDVRVYSGLMDVMTDDEVFGVLGHEIGHVKNQDSKNAMKNALLTSAARDAIASTSSTVAALTDSQLGDIGEAYINARHSQKQESEADNFGYDFLKSHSVNPWNMAMAFEQLQALEGGAQSSTIQKMFASHPDTASRVKKMSDRATADGYKKPARK
jgi:putative metalloprotease